MPKYLLPRQITTPRTWFWKVFSISLAVLGLLFLPGCPSVLTVPGEDAPPTEFDIAELAPGSLDIPVTDYTWTYLNGNAHVRVIGTVFNNTGAPVQGVRIQGVLHDQKGVPIAYGESFVVPSYLAVNAKGTFEFVALVKKESGVTATRLVTLAYVRTYY
ncbi:MAG: hypothetical protein LBF22_08225 [Deltaproteobacteria bacterium]|jgi:hypothetical protein|nr:hypothetical protein [Deltaproteobacteria bacterium]